MTPEEKKLLLTKQYQKELKLTQKLAREESKLASQGSKSTEQRLKAQQKITKLKEKEHSLQLKIRNIDKEVEQIYKKEKTYIDDIAKKLEEINVSDSKKAKSAKAIHGISSMVAELEQKKLGEEIISKGEQEALAAKHGKARGRLQAVKGMVDAVQTGVAALKPESYEASLEGKIKRTV